MKNTKKLISVFAILISLLLSACSEVSGSNASDTFAVDSGAATSRQAASDSNQAPQTPTLESQQDIPNPSQKSFGIEDIVPYSGQPYMTVNDNTPYFSEEDLTLQSFAFYSDLDDLNRCGVAYASIGVDIMPTKERDAIGHIKPSGWHTVKYNDIIDGNYLYNRCHLIGYQLCGENDEKNLFTGTRYLNVKGMQPFENQVAGYVKATENHVLYRVTPIFEGDNLLASGVLMEAESIEDNGENICFCVFVYNVQPGIIIDYSTGESSLASDMQTGESDSSAVRFPVSTPEPTTVLTLEPTAAPTPKPTAAPAETSPITKGEEPKSTTYILNTNTKKFHFPYCRYVKQIKDKNRQEYTGTRDDVISQGYVSCKNCNP